MKTKLLLLMVSLFFVACSSKHVIAPDSDLLLDHQDIYYKESTYTLVDILYGTDREDTKSDILNNIYNGNRSQLKYGVAQVSIPITHTRGELERPIMLESEKINEHIMLYKINRLHKETFNRLLKLKTYKVKEKDILVFIHGFNVSFDEAIRRTGQLTYDLDFKGVPITYSWPSAGNLGDYMKDESSVQYTTPHLVQFLSNIIDNKAKDVNIHILAHSMGTRALTNAIKELSFKYYGKKLFKNIILAAPDIDKDVFKVSLLPYITKTADKMTLYASSDDAALKLSQSLHDGERVGQGGDNIFVFKSLNTIDATGIDTSLLGHSYFAQKELLMGDIKDIIYKSLPPIKREALKKEVKDNLDYWRFIK